ncbi:MAG: class I SAM-dependent methyltransferase [Candidatus Portnoybacteria bacterium]|nr:class I SAM-dependent methyltransferase [Candidatus Portnoybacteria bacterium]
MKYTGEQALLGEVSRRRNNRDHLTRYGFIREMVKDKIVLDVACGTGYGSAMIKEAGAKKVFGVDHSAEAISHARENYAKEGVEFICGSAARLDFGDNYFDMVVSFETIEHLDASTRDAYLSEIGRVLEPGGIFIISTPNRKVVSPFSKKPHYKFHIIEYVEKELLDILRRFEFIDFNVYGQRIIKKIYNISIVRKLAHFVEENILKRRIDLYWLAKGPQVVKYNRWNEPRYYVIICRKKT